MAVITRIRQYFWLLVVMMVLGLVGFMFMGNGDQGSAGPDTMGIVNGKKISWKKFQNAQSALYSGGGNYLAQRSSLWNHFYEEAIISSEAEKLGLGVCDKEVVVLEFGQDGKFYSDVIRERNTDRQTGQFDRSNLDTVKNILIDPNRNLPTDYKRFWVFQEKEIVKSRLKNKMAALVSKAAYTPTWMIEVLAENQNKKANVAYVKIPFGNISDDQVTLTDQDYTNYLKANKAKYFRKNPTRKLAYVSFKIEPTAQDSINLRKEMVKAKNIFIEAKQGDSMFVVASGGVWDDSYVLESNMPKPVASELMAAPIGSVVGPYIENGNYAITKVIDRKTIPDSVRSRHILLKPVGERGYYTAFQTLDSLKNLLEAGTANFAALAAQYSQDNANKMKGGDLKFVGPKVMVKPFNDLIFYKAKKGELNIVGTQFGLHLVEVTGKKFTNNLSGVKMGTVRKLIVPSVSTGNTVVKSASRFARDNPSPDAMKAAAEADPAITYEESKLVEENDFFIGSLGSNEQSRDIIRWAFDKNTKSGTVNANIFEFKAPSGIYSNKAVVVALKAKVKAGLPSASVMKEDLKSLVTFEKKGALIKEKLGASTDLNSVASTYNVKIDTANNVSFTNAFIPGIGNEPKVIGAIFNTAEGSNSQPIVGSGGVFVVKPIKIVKSNIPANVDMVRAQQDNTFSARAKNSILVGLKKKAKVEDSRSIFY